MNVKEKIKKKKNEIARQNYKFFKLLDGVKDFCSDPEFNHYDYKLLDADTFDIKYNDLSFITVKKYPHIHEYIYLVTNTRVPYSLQDVEGALESFLADHWCKREFLDKP